MQQCQFCLIFCFHSVYYVEKSTVQTLNGINTLYKLNLIDLDLKFKQGQGYENEFVLQKRHSNVAITLAWEDPKIQFYFFFCDKSRQCPLVSRPQIYCVSQSKAVYQLFFYTELYEVQLTYNKAFKKMCITCNARQCNVCFVCF